MDNKLQELRWKRGWSQKDLSRESGVPRNTISNIESGRIANPSVKTAILLARALDVRVIDIFIITTGG